jgi:hypothetical protein
MGLSRGERNARSFSFVPTPSSSYLARLYLVADSLRWYRTDSSVIRITAGAGNRPDQLVLAEWAAVEFGDAIFPLLDQYAPR